MPTLAQIIVLLSAILQLYQNPEVVSNPAYKAQVDLMATQVISLAQQAATQPPETQLGAAPTSTEPLNIYIPTTTPQVSPPQQNIGTVDLTPIVEPESCSLQVTKVVDGDRTGRYVWTSTGVPTSTQGQVYFGSYINNGAELHWFPIGDKVEKSQGEFDLSYRAIPGAGPTFNQAAQFMLQLDNATCTANYAPQ